MDLFWKIDEKEYNVKFGKINILFGSNNSKKKIILNTIKDGFSGGNKNFLINNAMVSKNEYNVLYYSEDTDFIKEFKFSKTNNFRNKIYNNVLSEIDEDNLLKDANKIFDTIDDKINDELNNSINNNSDDKIKFDTNFDSIDTIIDKFTNIYINDILASDDSITKSQKRKLIFQMLANYNDSNDVIIIDNFDAYLDDNEVINILNKMEKSNAKYILSAGHNIYENINNDINVFKVNDDKIISFNNFSGIIKNAIIRDNNCNEENENLISDDDIMEYYNKIFIPNKHNIGKFLANDNVTLLSKYENNLDTTYIVYNDSNINLLKLIKIYLTGKDFDDII